MNVPATLDLPSALRANFGFGDFRPGQMTVIVHLLQGHSAAAVFPTGGGKSLCYQFPALLLPGVTLVVSPLIALMKDQIDALAARGIAARRLDSTLTLDQHRDVMRLVRRGELRLLYVAPERFQNERFREMLRQIKVALFAVDEAHCISEWGHNFRPDYLKLVEFARQCGAERVLALTATATPAVLDDICRAFQIAPECATRTGFYRANLTMLTTPVEAADRDYMLLERIRDRPAGPAIVYVTLQKTAEQVAARLASQGLAARAYHAGLKDELRTEAQEWFFATGNPIVVATIAFGMGIDKANIRYVYHYNMPKSLENYAQEIGRAGRDDEPATCEMFVCPDDLQTLENFAYGDTPTGRAVDGLVGEIFHQPQSFDVSYFDLAGRHDIRILVVRTLLTYLELDGFIEGGTPFYAGYKLKALRASRDILAQFEGERRQFLEQLFRQFQPAKTWLHLDVDAAATVIGTTRDRIVRALDYLAEQGLMEVEAEGVRNRYQIVRRPEDVGQLAASLHARTIQREGQEIGRLHQVLELVQHPGCQVLALCRHFGEDRAEPCGHCTWCLSKGQPLAMPARKVIAIDEAIVKQAEVVRRKYAVLADSQSMARFLCGLTSPAFTKAKLSGHSLFGALSDAAFPDVLRHFN